MSSTQWSLLLPFSIHICFPPPVPPLTPGNLQFVLQFCNYASSRVSYEWNHILHDLLFCFVLVQLSGESSGLLCISLWYECSHGMSMPVSLTTYLLIEGHLSCFHFLAVMTKAAISIWVQVFVWTYVFVSRGKNAKSVFSKWLYLAFLKTAELFSRVTVTLQFC